MVRINLINPKCLADQHLIAEYDEILMLLGYVKRYPTLNLNKIPKEYHLGKGHIKFFKDKLLYLKRRHELIKKEMQNRGFKTNKTINLQSFKKELKNDWKPNIRDKNIIKKRLIQKLKKKPRYYRYYGKNKPLRFFINIINEE
jgi:deoxyribonuclease (pyrimidine dimer)